MFRPFQGSSYLYTFVINGKPARLNCGQLGVIFYGFFLHAHVTAEWRKEIRLRLPYVELALLCQRLLKFSAPCFPYCYRAIWMGYFRVCIFGLV